MSEWLILLIFIVYLGIGVIFNGAMNEEWQKFSFILMLFWPLALAMLIFLVLSHCYMVSARKLRKSGYDAT